MTKTTSFGSKAGNIIKDFFSGNTASKGIINPGTYSGSQKGWLFDTPGVGHDTYFSFNDDDAIVKAYELCPPVFSIVNKQATSIMNGTTYIMNKKGKEATNEWATKVRKLLSNPNSLQNQKQFEAQMIIYLRLFGYCVILPIKPVGFGNEDATSLWVIPPFMLKFTYKDGKFYNMKDGYIKKIEICFNNETGELNPNEVIILKDIAPGSGYFLPGSPIEPIQQNINNLIGIYNSKGTLINYRGALGILSPEIDPNGALTQTEEEKEELQNAFLKYGLKSNQWKFIISNAAMKWQQMGVPYRDLMLTEWAEDDTMVICDALNYKYKLLSNTTSSSMNGSELKEWKLAQIQDFTIPYANMIFEQISEAFKAAENGCTIIKDFATLPELQENDLERSQARKMRNDALQIEFYNNLITVNRWLELNDEDTLPDEMGKKYYYELVKMGWSFGKGAPVAAPKEETV